MLFIVHVYRQASIALLIFSYRHYSGQNKMHDKKYLYGEIRHWKIEQVNETIMEYIFIILISIQAKFERFKDYNRLNGFGKYTTK